MGTKWITGDVITFARMNQKTQIVQAVEPALMYPGMLWLDTDNDLLYQRKNANDGWYTILKEELAYEITGLHTFNRGAAAPFAVDAASLVVANLDADLLDGSHYPPSDPVAGTAGLRTLGVGAQQAAAGNHTHTLTAEAQSITKVTTVPFQYLDHGFVCDFEVLAGTEVSFVSKADNFSALSKAVAFFSGIFSAIDFTFKFRLYMGGVLVATSIFLTPGYNLYTLMGDRSLSGAQTVEVKVWNSSGADRTFAWACIDETTDLMHPTLAVGSVKI